jgi:hypothetical protein
MHLEVHEVFKGAVHVPHEPHVQGLVPIEVQEDHEAHQNDQHELEVIFFAVYD